MSKAVTKKKEDVVVKAPVAETVVVDATPMADTKLAVIDKAVVSDEKPKLVDDTEKFGESLERQKANVELVKGLELSEIRSVLMKDYYGGGWEGKSKTESTSSVTINGEKIEPLIAGVERAFSSLAMAYSSRGHLFTRKIRGGYESDEISGDKERFDIYIFKIKNPRAKRPMFNGVAEINALEEKLTDGYFYQILILGSNTTVNITNDLKEPNPYIHENEPFSGRYGILVARESSISNSLFFDQNVIDNAELKDVTLRRSNIINGKYGQRTHLSDMDINETTLQAVTASNTSKYHYNRGRIVKSDLSDIRFSGERVNIRHSRLKNVTLNSRGVTLRNARLTKLVLNTKDTIEIRDTVLHHEDTYCYSTGDSIILNSIFDAMVCNFTNGASVYLIRGRKNFWVGGNGSEINEASLEIKRVENSEYRRPHFAHYGESDSELNLNQFVKRAVNSELGCSELTQSIIDTIKRQITERIAIADSIATANKIRKSSENGYYF